MRLIKSKNNKFIIEKSDFMGFSGLYDFHPKREKRNRINGLGSPLYNRSFIDEKIDKKLEKYQKEKHPLDNLEEMPLDKFANIVKNLLSKKDDEVKQLKDQIKELEEKVYSLEEKQKEKKYI